MYSQLHLSLCFFFFLDGILVRTRPLRVARLHQPPGAEDHPEQPAPLSRWLSSPRAGRLGDLQGPERQALLLQPLHPGEDLEAAPSQGHQHRELQRREPQRGRELRGTCRLTVGFQTHTLFYPSV